MTPEKLLTGGKDNSPRTKIVLVNTSMLRNADGPDCSPDFSRQTLEKAWNMKEGTFFHLRVNIQKDPHYEFPWKLQNACAPYISPRPNMFLGLILFRRKKHILIHWVLNIYGKNHNKLWPVFDQNIAESPKMNPYIV